MGKPRCAAVDTVLAWKHAGDMGQGGPAVLGSEAPVGTCSGKEGLHSTQQPV